MRVKCSPIHSVLKSDFPDFVKDMVRPEDLYRAVMSRVDDVVGHFRYR